MKRKMILSTMLGMAVMGAFAAAPASAQFYPGDGARYGADYRQIEYRGVSRHDHYAAWVTQQRKLRVQHERAANQQQYRQQRGDGPHDYRDQDGRHGDDRYQH